MCALEVNFAVDWLTMTFTSGDPMTFARSMGYGEMSQTDAVPPRGYNVCVELESGLRIAKHSERPEQGTLFQLSGNCIAWYLVHQEMTWHAIMSSSKNNGGRASRVDLAIDAKNSGLTLVDLCKPNLIPYRGKGRTPKYIPVGTQEDGWRVYVGSRQSEKFLRVYDKAKEQGWENTDIVRIELECKGEVAHAIGWEFPHMEIAQCVDMAKTLIKTVASFRVDAWDEIMLSREVGLSLPKPSERDTLGWLVRVAAPALAKQMHKKASQDVLGAFWDALREELNKLGMDVTPR